VLVSVVTPCLNPGMRLARCLDSVAAQSYQGVEHIVVDGGSTDGTLDVLAERGIRFVSGPDRGQTDAINKGFRLAQGEVLGWLNADDVLVPGAIEAVVAALHRKPSAGWVYGECEVRRHGARELPIRPPARIGKATLDCGSVLAQPGFFVTRWALDQVGELDEAFHLAMDFDLWLRLIDANIGAVRVPTTLALFELHEGSKSGSTPSSGFFFEEGLALLKSGRRRQAAFSFGRSAWADGDIDQVLGDPRICDARLDRTAVVAGARTEAAIAGLLAGSPQALRMLLRPDVWRVPETRRRLRLAFRNMFPVLVGRFRR
jgi:glycosyltransferase involved in cell wall biosynthesis